MARFRKILLNLKLKRLQRRLLAAASISLLCAAEALAALAGDLASVGHDTSAFGASTSQTALGTATVYTQTLSNGLLVRQYVDAIGLVFAVAWEGPVLPDFERLLGTAFQTYAVAVRQQKRGVTIQTPDLVIESGGMMRSFAGRAFLPAKLPSNLTAKDIR
jgi:hypothetical protein